MDNVYPDPFPPSWAETWGEDEYGLFADLHYKAVIQRFRWIAPGDFLMGSPENEPERLGWEDQHKITLTQGYWLADTAVTQQFWQAVNGKNPADFKDDQNNPVESISWNDCHKFVKMLNQHFPDQRDGFVFRLPTEAEWEHACRAGTTTPFSFGGNITSEQVNFNGSHPYNKGRVSEYRRKTVAVKFFAPNQWGLYEMHGNVWEWCADVWQGHSGTQPVTDPYHSGDEKARCVNRGGSWIGHGWSVRSAYRDHYSPGECGNSFGFRLALGHELKARSAKSGK